MNTVIGIVGIGTMGRLITDLVIRAGYDVYATDLVESSRKKAEELGAKIIDSPREVAEKCKWIILSLPGPAQIHSVVGDKENGLAAALGSKHIIIDTSTVDPGTTREAAELCSSKGARYLDAPILGRPASIGNWLLPVGGDGGALEEVQPLLATFAKKAVHVGESGAGAALKVVNQMMFSVINGITAEAFAVAEKLGISPDTFYKTVADSGAATVSGLFRECGKKIVGDEFDPVFSVDLLCKDAGLGVTAAEEYGAPTLIASTVQTCNLLAKAQGLGSEDTSALVKVFRQMYGD